jgi:hypothetical protein
MMRTTIALVIGVLAVLPVAPAGADPDGEGPTSFEGTCAFSGTLRQKPPLTNLPQAGEASASAVGACSGALTDEDGDVRRLDGDRARYFASARGTASCGGGSAVGSGFIQIRGARLRFRFSEVRGPGAGAITLDGKRGGSAAGVARVSEDEDPLEIARLCSGKGLRQVGIDIDIATTPALSG